MRTFLIRAELLSERPRSCTGSYGECEGPESGSCSVVLADLNSAGLAALTLVAILSSIRITGPCHCAQIHQLLLD